MEDWHDEDVPLEQRRAIEKGNDHVVTQYLASRKSAGNDVAELARRLGHAAFCPLSTTASVTSATTGCGCRVRITNSKP
jgi:hypothetical protein